MGDILKFYRNKISRKFEKITQSIRASTAPFVAATKNAVRYNEWRALALDFSRHFNSGKFLKTPHFVM